MCASVEMDNAQLATFHCEVAVKLMGRKFVEDWLAEMTPVPVAPAETATVPKSNRGRKPGAAADTERCAWSSTTGQCKNKFSEGSTYCKMHDKKAALIASVSVSVSASETAESSH